MRICLMLIVLFLAGCATYDIKMGNAQVKLTYFGQDKRFKSLSYNPNTNEIKVVNFGSETSQVVEAAITTALRGAK